MYFGFGHSTSNGYWNDKWLLDIDIYDLTDKDELILKCGDYIYENKCSIRYASRNLGVAKSTLHVYVSKRLRSISYELYQCVHRQLEINYKKYFK